MWYLFGFRIIFFGILCSVVQAEYPLEFTAQVQSYPHIIHQKDQCLPLKGTYDHPQTYVCDPNRLLTLNEINRLNTLLKEFRGSDRDTAGCNPNNPKPVIAIALVNKLRVGNKDPDRLLSYAAVFAYYLFNEWNLPTNCHTGSDKVLILYSKADGVLYTFAGNLLEQKLTSETLVRIAIESRLPFSEGIFEGLTHVIRKYRDEIFEGRSRLFESNRYGKLR